MIAMVSQPSADAPQLRQRDVVALAHYRDGSEPDQVLEVVSSVEGRMWPTSISGAEEPGLIPVPKLLEREASQPADLICREDAEQALLCHHHLHCSAQRRPPDVLAACADY